MKQKRICHAIFLAVVLFLVLVKRPAAESSNFQNTLISEHSMQLSERYKDPFVNEVMKKNILLELAYMSGKITSPGQIKWPDIEKPFQFDVVLHPGEFFTFHDDVPVQYKNRIAKTGNAHFLYQEGFVSDGYLAGDGVCHLASLINWTALDAGLSVVAPTNHDFATIPQIPREYGVAVYYNPGQHTTNQMQNLYIINNKNWDIYLRFTYDGDKVRASVFKFAI